MASPQLAEKVFEKDLVLEVIIAKAILENHGSPSVDYATVKSLRLFRKRWNATVTKVLCDNKLPLYNLELTDNLHSMSLLTELIGSARNLAQLISSVNLTDVPTFNLQIRPEFFRDKNYEVLRGCLLEYGQRLIIGLNISLPEHGGSLKCVFPNLVFETLQRISIRLSEMDLPLGNEEQCSMDNLTHLLNALLNGAAGLKEFRVVTYDVDTMGWIDFQLLSLPPTLTSLSLLCPMTDRDVQVMTRNRLPQLTSLMLLVKRAPFEDGLMFNVLDNVKASLKSLTIVREAYLGPPRIPTSVTLPVMSSLESFIAASINITIDELLPSCLPQLETLGLISQTREAFQRWSRDGRQVFASVTKLLLVLVDENFPENDEDNHFVSVDQQIMQCVRLTFPNLTKLHLTTRASGTLAIMYIFQNMTQLQWLTLEVFGNVTDADIWDSLIIGTPLEIVTVLKETPDCWSNVEMNNLSPSIRNLHELTHFGLHGDNDGMDNNESLISDVSFQFGFLKMPNLRALCFKGLFRASQQMIEEWKQNGRIIITE